MLTLNNLPGFIKVGAKVNYHSIIGGPVTLPNQTITHAPWALGGNETNIVVMITGKSACVAVDALSEYKEEI